jgi:glycosyltransferase involved in cell wall biosynthesis
MNIEKQNIDFSSTNSQEEPLVSIVMPVYNAERTLESAIQSVLSQTYVNLELIIVNDGSTDNSLKIIESQKDSRIQLFSKKNGGPASAQNLGFSKVSGEFVALHDSDDLWVSEKIASHINHLRRSPDIDVSYAYSQMIDRDGNLLFNIQKPPLKAIEPLDILLNYPIGNGSNAVFRSKLLHLCAEGGHPIVYESLKTNHDIEMWFRFAYLLGAKFEGIPKILNYYRVHSDGYSSQMEAKEKSYEETLTFISNYAPDYVVRYGSQARTAHYRYLARKAIFNDSFSLALKFLVKSMLSSPVYFFFDKPAKSFVTLVAAVFFPAIPRGIRQRIYRERINRRFI